MLRSGYLGMRICGLATQQTGRHFRSQRIQQAQKQHYSRNGTHSAFAFYTIGGSIGAFIAYDGVENEFAYCGAAFRFLRSLKTAACISWDYLLLEQHESDADYELQLQAVHQKSANRLLDTCLRNGGMYIKVGQGFAAINHILPKEYVDTLMLLQDKCLFTTRADVQKVFRKDFDGQLPEDIYAEFDYKPVAAASLAQVFKARLKSGEQVAVKVQYSDLQKRFPSDLGTIVFLQNIIECFFKDYNFGWILHDLRKNLEQELDFVHEAHNAERCARDMSKFEFVKVPRIDWSHTTTCVLTMQWMEGFKVNDLETIKDNKLDLCDIDAKLFKIFAEQIFRTGFVHADPHSSNVFLCKNPKTHKADIILLDHGLYEELPEAVRQPLCEFWEATVLRNEPRMQAAAQRIGITDYMKFAEVLFQQPISIHGGRVRTKLTEADIEYMQQIAKQNFDMIMQTLREMPRNMLFVVRNLNTIRAIGRQHGDIVNRPNVMARHAQRCLLLQNTTFLFSHVRWLYRRVHFEFAMWYSAFKMSCLNFYFNMLYSMGRAPASAKTVLKDMLSPDLS